ncbi:OstA-like protein [Alloprevotella rava]|nr:OstA-like protein [Alloprevotella rava]
MERKERKQIYALVLVSILGLLWLGAYAAHPKKRVSERIFLVHADNLRYNEFEQPDAQRLSGKVHFRQGGMNMYADSAVYFQAANSFEAFGHVRILQGDTLSLVGEQLYYDGEAMLAQIRRNVILRHRKQVLRTDSLNFDRLYDVGYFFNGGQLIDGQNDLTSDWGEYYLGEQKASFNFNVKLKNPKFTLTTDTLHYNVRTKWAEVQGPSNIYHGKDVVYTERGYYNSEKEVYRLSNVSKRTELYHNAITHNGRITDYESRLLGDSLVYEKDDKMKVFGHAFYEDKKNRGQLMGDYGEYHEDLGIAMATGNALAKEYSQGKDTLFVHADTLRLYSYDLETDKPKTKDTKNIYRVLHGYFHVRSFRDDVQAVCDSLVFNSQKKLLTLYRDPIVWSDNRQVLGEEINVFTNDSTIDSIHVDRQALLVEQLQTDSAIVYNQITGQQMRSYFVNGQMDHNEVQGNVCIVYYPLDKDSVLDNVVYAETSKLRMTLANKKLKRIWGPATTGTVYPVALAPSDKTILPNFAWFDYIRPLNKSDLFNWRGKKKGSELKIMPRREAPLQHFSKD